MPRAGDPYERAAPRPSAPPFRVRVFVCVACRSGFQCLFVFLFPPPLPLPSLPPSLSLLPSPFPSRSVFVSFFRLRRGRSGARCSQGWFQLVWGVVDAVRRADIGSHWRTLPEYNTHITLAFALDAQCTLRNVVGRGAVELIPMEARNNNSACASDGSSAPCCCCSSSCPHCTGCFCSSGSTD